MTKQKLIIFNKDSKIKMYIQKNINSIIDKEIKLI